MRRERNDDIYLSIYPFHYLPTTICRLSCLADAASTPREMNSARPVEMETAEGLIGDSEQLRKERE
jgi:hypothetical protein